MREAKQQPETAERSERPVQGVVRTDCGMDDGESMGDFWRDVKAARKAKRADNRASSPELLTKAGITYSCKNGGAHLIVTVRGHTIDFWPGTGLWMMRGSTKRHGGVHSLIRFVNGLTA